MLAPCSGTLCPPQLLDKSPFFTNCPTSGVFTSHNTKWTKTTTKKYLLKLPLSTSLRRLVPSLHFPSDISVEMFKILKERENKEGTDYKPREQLRGCQVHLLRAGLLARIMWIVSSNPLGMKVLRVPSLQLT